MDNNNYPLILALYYDRSLMDSPEILNAMATGINNQLVAKDANAMAFFLPTDGEERIECINPVQVEEADMAKINTIMEDIKKHYDIGQGADDGKDDPDNMVEIDN